jgi:hypothetical protein
VATHHRCRLAPSHRAAIVRPDPSRSPSSSPFSPHFKGQLAEIGLLRTKEVAFSSPDGGGARRLFREHAALSDPTVLLTNNNDTNNDIDNDTPPPPPG